MIRAFVSSTYRDLKDHRAYVIERLARSGIFVDPMEKWTAASDEPKDLSQDRVKDCQLCILLVGFRRGHVPEGESRSITQMEYVQALRLKVKVLIFMASEEADWPMDPVAALKEDPEMARWRDELKEHKCVGFFGPRPESIDVDAAVNRWLQELVVDPAKSGSGRQGDNSHMIDIRTCSNSEGVLIAWRTERPIEGCLGFALYREVMGDAGATQEVVATRLPFSSVRGTQPSRLSPSTLAPIQNFRWIDREQREARYRVVPVVGTPSALSLPIEEQIGSAWTGWVSPRTGQNPGCRAFFNAAHNRLARPQRHGADINEEALFKVRGKGPALRTQFGGGLRQRLLEILTAAKVGARRTYAALADLDDPEIISMIKNLGGNMRLILPQSSTPQGRRQMVNGEGSAKLCKELRAASVHVYHQAQGDRAARSNFVVSCDRWGIPLSVWTGSAAWTTRALCTHSNTGIFMESVPLARAYLDRWHDLLENRTGRLVGNARSEFTPVDIREDGMSITLWNTPTHGRGDLRDARRLIRGARHGVLYLVNDRRIVETLLQDTFRRHRDDDLFVEGVSQVARGRHIAYEYQYNEVRTTFDPSFSGQVIDSTIVLVDPFGPHPVVMTGSHDLSSESSEKSYSDLLIIENSPRIAAEYATHLIGMFDRFRFLATARRNKLFIGLEPTHDWQERYFKGRKRREFNFLFGALSLGF